MMLLFQKLVVLRFIFHTMRTIQTALLPVLWWLTVALGAGPGAAIDRSISQRSNV